MNIITKAERLARPDDYENESYKVDAMNVSKLMSQFEKKKKINQSC